MRLAFFPRSQHWKLNSSKLPILWIIARMQEASVIVNSPPSRPYASLNSRLFLACTVDARLNMLKTLGIGAKDLSLSPAVIRGSAMTGDNGVGNAASTPGVGAAAGNCTTVVYAFPEEDHLVVGYLNEWINAYSFITSEYTISRVLLSAGKPLQSAIDPDDFCHGWTRQVVCPANELGERYFSRSCLWLYPAVHACKGKWSFSEID